MAELDRTARNLETAFILSYFVQAGALALILVGFSSWGHERSAGWGLWLGLGGGVCFLACHLFQKFVKRWWRRRFPIESSSQTHPSPP